MDRHTDQKPYVLLWGGVKITVLIGQKQTYINYKCKHTTNRKVNKINTVYRKKMYMVMYIILRTVI